MVIAQGGASSLGGIGSLETHLAEGDVAELRLRMKYIPPGTVATIKAVLRAKGSPATVRTAPGREIVIQWQKGYAQLAIIAIVLISLTIILMAVSGWTLSKLEKAGPAAVGALGLGLGVLVLGGLVLMGGKRGSG